MTGDGDGDDAHILSLNEHLNQPFDCPVCGNFDVQVLSAANGTVFAFLVLEGVRVYAVGTDKHEVVVEEGGRRSGNLEGLGTTRSCEEHG